MVFSNECIHARAMGACVQRMGTPVQPNSICKQPSPLPWPLQMRDRWHMWAMGLHQGVKICASILDGTMHRGTCWGAECKGVPTRWSQIYPSLYATMNLFQRGLEGKPLPLGGSFHLNTSRSRLHSTHPASTPHACYTLYALMLLFDPPVGLVLPFGLVRLFRHYKSTNLTPPSNSQPSWRSPGLSFIPFFTVRF